MPDEHFAPVTDHELAIAEADRRKEFVEVFRRNGVDHTEAIQKDVIMRLIINERRRRVLVNAS